MDNYILFTILILLIICSFCYLNMYNDIETFQVYSYSPFNYLTTGSDPLTFYKYPIYRNPYRYPYQFYSSYPYPYMSYYPTNI
jgi:hypothetical protein